MKSHRCRLKCSAYCGTFGFSFLNLAQCPVVAKRASCLPYISLSRVRPSHLLPSKRTHSGILPYHQDCGLPHSCPYLAWEEEATLLEPTTSRQQPIAASSLVTMVVTVIRWQTSRNNLGRRNWSSLVVSHQMSSASLLFTLTECLSTYFCYGFATLVCYIVEWDSMI